MAQEIKDDIFKLELAFRQAVLKIKTAKCGNHVLCIHHLDALNFINPKEIWKKDGENEFAAEAEFFFVPDNDGGVYQSLGNYRFHGKVQKNGKDFTLITPIVIDDSINTCYLKKCKE